MVMLVLNESFNVFLRHTTLVNVFMICCEAMCSVQRDITVEIQVTHGIHHQCLWTAGGNEYLNTFSSQKSQGFAGRLRHGVSLERN